EQAVLEGRGDALGVDAVRQPDRAVEGAKAALHSAEGVRRLVGVELALARHGQHVLLDRHVNVVCGNAGQLDVESESVVVLFDVERGAKGAVKRGFRIAKERADDALEVVVPRARRGQSWSNDVSPHDEPPW